MDYIIENPDVWFDITRKRKRKALRKRMLHDPKWGIWLKLSLLVFVIWMVLMIIWDVTTPESVAPAGMEHPDLYMSSEEADHELLLLPLTFILVFSVSFYGVSNALCRQFIFADRWSEKLWIKDGILYHSYSPDRGAGLNTFQANLWLSLTYAMDISTITHARYDEKSGRIEFCASGKGYKFDQYGNEAPKLPKEWDLHGEVNGEPGFVACFYEYMSPNLVEILEKEYGIAFERGKIENYVWRNRM